MVRDSPPRHTARRGRTVQRGSPRLSCGGTTPIFDYQQATTMEMIGGRCCDIVIPAIRGPKRARTRTAVVVSSHG